jgi:hypothetical protein
MMFFLKTILFFIICSSGATCFATEGYPILPLVIYSEAYDYEKPFQFVPSGWMGDVHTLRVNDDWTDNPRSGSSCIKFIYETEKPWSAGWVGVAWQYPANNWGNIDGGVNLRGAKKLTFWARGETGSEYVNFKFGGNYGVFSDTTELATGPVQLSKEWSEYAIDLTREDLSHISCGFSWVADKTEQNADKVIFYLDDIRIE